MTQSARREEASRDRRYVAAVKWLRVRSADIAEQIDTSLPSLGHDPARHDDIDYKSSRVAAITATVQYSLDTIERGGLWGPIPSALAEHTRRAAQLGVGLGALVRRYLSGHNRFMDFIHDEIALGGFTDNETLLEHLTSDIGALAEHVITSIEREYEQEREHVASSPELRRARLVQRLLIENVNAADLGELDYEVDRCWHLGVIALGDNGKTALHRLQSALRRRILSIQGDDGAVWAWLGSREKLSVSEFERLLSVNGCTDASYAVGEPRQGLAGWRQTHHEAKFAVIMARHESRGVTRCADALPVIGAVQNEAIIEMYEKTYILPLNELYKRGYPARKSLLAYFKYGRSASAAARATKMTARTVQNHLNDARGVLDPPLNMTGLEIALRLEELGYMASADVGDDRPTKRKSQTAS